MNWTTAALVTIAPILGVFVGIAAQVGVHMSLPNKPIVFSYAAGFVCGAAVSLAVLVGCFPETSLSDAIVCFSTFGGLNYCYNNFVNLNFSSLRIRLLKEVLSSGGTESLAAITSQYGSKAVLQRRLERLVSWRQLQEQNSRYRANGGSFLLLALIFSVLKKIMLGRGFKYECRVGKNSKLA
jgi:hypothetical protein